MTSVAVGEIDWERLAACGADDRTVRLWDARGNRPPTTVPKGPLLIKRGREILLSDSKLNATESPKLFATEKESRGKPRQTTSMSGFCLCKSGGFIFLHFSQNFDDPLFN